MMLRRTLLATAIPMVVLAACSLPTDERAVVYDRDDLPADIADTTTTTTTTTTTSTTTVPTTTVPTSVDASEPTPVTTTTTTTTSPTRTELIDLYYTIGVSNELSRLRVQVNENASVSQVIEQLQRPNADVADVGLRTAVRTGMVVSQEIVVERGLATVPLDADVIDPMTETSLRRAIAQLVLTLSSFRTVNSGNISSVVFEVDGESFPVFVPAFGGTSDEDEALFYEDFAPLIASTGGATPDSSTTIPDTETTEPSDSTLDDAG